MDGYLLDIRYSKSAFSEHHLHWKIPGMFQSLASSCGLYLRTHKKQLPYGHHCANIITSLLRHEIYVCLLRSEVGRMGFSFRFLPSILRCSASDFFYFLYCVFFLPIVVIHSHLCIASCLCISCSIICSFSADSRKGLPVPYVMLLL